MTSDQLKIMFADTTRKRTRGRAQVRRMKEVIRRGGREEKPDVELELEGNEGIEVDRMTEWQEPLIPLPDLKSPMQDDRVGGKRRRGGGG